ncbi:MULTISPECIES: hypothetical protein [Sphingobacterium]|uniref:DUF4328 domain-containing protein n=1 Tax=Sphingobacterium thermophilum TaxID=768534 RepID=A0ABP8R942_9SPHI|nr:hypothetical protein [Sphingobacterium sp. T2]
MEEILNSPEFQAILPYAPYIFLAFVIRLVLLILFCMMADSTLQLIKEENRCLARGQVWFLLLPFFNIYWNFVVVRRLTDSLNNEFYDRKQAVEENPTQKMGFFFAGTFLVYNFPLPMFIGFVLFILNMVALFLYFLKVKEHRELLRNGVEEG